MSDITEKPELTIMHDICEKALAANTESLRRLNGWTGDKQSTIPKGEAMGTKDDGGAAFPAHQEGYMPHYGMSLRDYFAAKAMQGLACDQYDEGWAREGLARQAYLIADAMLAERANE